MSQERRPGSGFRGHVTVRRGSDVGTGSWRPRGGPRNRPSPGELSAPAMRRAEPNPPDRTRTAPLALMSAFSLRVCVRACVCMASTELVPAVHEELSSFRRRRQASRQARLQTRLQTGPKGPVPNKNSPKPPRTRTDPRAPKIARIGRADLVQ